MSAAFFEKQNFKRFGTSTLFGSKKLAPSPAMAADGGVAQEVIMRMGKASVFLTDNERRFEIGVACEVAKDTLLRSARQLVDGAGGRPVLTSKSCDGTPITVTHRSVFEQPGGKKIRTTGRQCMEFLVQNQFLRTDMGSDGMQTSVLLSEPTPLTQGKSVGAILGASRENWWTLRQLGHKGISVEHYCWDRFSITSLDRETRLWHDGQPLPELPPYITTEVASLMELAVMTPYALHDAQTRLQVGALGCLQR